jgi:formylglycine-generating enzyme required for sulfatase activity
MSPAEAENAFARLLAAHDDALRGDGVPSLSLPLDLPPELADELEEAAGVLELLGRHGDCLPLPPDEGPTVPGPDGPAAPHAELGPARLGRYRIVRELGGGGGGIVFLAHDPLLDRQVALKVPRPEALLTESARRRFRQEARATAGLRHPHLVPVHDVGEDGAVCYLVTEYCPGGSLSDWLRGRPEPLGPRQAAELVARLARAVAYLHEHNVLHRDLKPANVLLEEDGTPRITDFGLARLLDGDGQGTQTGQAVGTPSYMAPEQAEGRKDVGRAADVYGLGAILYELLTGQPPFRGATRAETLRRVVAEDPVPPRRLRPGVPRDLETVCLKCLQKEPHKRYAGADELADDLDRYLTGRPIQARPAPAWERAAKWTRRRPAAAALLALLVLGTVAAAVAAVLLDRRRQADRAGALIETLLAADTDKVPAAVEELRPYRPWAEPRLRRLAAEGPADSRERLRVALGLLPWDEGQVDELYRRALLAPPAELKLIRDALSGHAATVAPRFRAVLEDPRAPAERRLRAAAALAGLDPDAIPRGAACEDVVDRLVREDPLAVRGWTDLLRPARSQLLGPLRAAFRDHSRAESSHVAAAILADHHADEPGFLIELLQESDPVQARYLVSHLDASAGRVLPALRALLAVQPPPGAGGGAKDHLARRQANVAAALIQLDPEGDNAPLLRLTPDPSRRTYLIHRLGPAEVDCARVADWLGRERDPSVRRALVLALGEYDPRQLSRGLRDDLAAHLAERHWSDPDPGMHSAAEWALRRWGALDRVGERLPARAARGDGELGWHVTAQGDTMIELRRPAEFWMGSPETEANRGQDEEQVRRRPRPFAIAAKKTTVAQYRRFLADHPDAVAPRAPRPDADPADYPVRYVSFDGAARYCNWLSEREGLPADQRCYRPLDGRPYGFMAPYPDCLTRLGYRLPTEEEWEYACRAGTTTARFFGESDDMLGHYAWFDNNADSGPRPVGLLMPNDFGLFDILGDLYEWCSDGRDPGPDKLVLRGFNYRSAPELCRAARRVTNVSHEHKSPTSGFRVVRTLPTAD